MTKWIKIFLVIVMLMVFFFRAEAVWVLNDPPPGCVGCERSASQDDSALILGAAGMLQSYSDFLLLLNESELSGIRGFDFVRAENFARTALEKLEIAQYNYYNSISILSGRDFDELLIAKLIDFDYEGYRIASELQSETMYRVAYYLSHGDVVGTYEAAYKDIGKMISTLSPILTDIRLGVVPKVEKLQKVYQQYSDFMQFGYYASLVFAEIRK
jgi:hypothetical protein